MLTIWGRANSMNVQKVLWAAEECGLRFERIDAGRGFGGTESPEYLAMNPNRLVPTVVDGDLSIWESNTCVRYLAATYGSGSLWPTDPRSRAVGERWMDWQLSTIFPPMNVVYWGLVRTPSEKRDMAAISASAKELGELWRRVDAGATRSAQCARLVRALARTASLHEACRGADELAQHAQLRGSTAGW